MDNDPQLLPEDPNPNRPSEEELEQIEYERAHQKRSDTGSKAFLIVLALLAVIIALVAAAFAAWSWYSFDNLSTSINTKSQLLDQQINQAQAQFDKTMKENQSSVSSAVQKTQTELQTSLQQAQQDVQQQRESIQQDINRNRTIAQQSLQNLSKIREINNLESTLGEAAYLVRVANQYITVNHDSDAALKLLNLAKDHLQGIQDPRVSKIAALLESSINKLSTAQTVNTADVIAQLDKLGTSIAALPPISTEGLRQRLQNNPASTPPTAGAANKGPENPSWQDHLGSTVKDLKGFFIVRRHDQAIEPLLAPDQLKYLIENLQLKVSQAQWAVMNNKPDLYKESLQIASQWIRQYYQQDPALVANLLSEIATLQQINISPALPNVADALTMIEDLIKELNAEQHLNLENSLKMGEPIAPSPSVSTTETSPNSTATTGTTPTTPPLETGNEAPITPLETKDATAAITPLPPGGETLSSVPPPGIEMPTARPAPSNTPGSGQFPFVPLTPGGAASAPTTTHPVDSNPSEMHAFKAKPSGSMASAPKASPTNSFPSESESTQRAPFAPSKPAGKSTWRYGSAGKTS